MSTTAKQEIHLPQGTIRCREAGEGEPLVFVHGLLVNSRLWEGVAERLQGEFRCILPDLPLGSHTIAMNPDAELGAPGQAAIVAELLEQLGLERATLVGNDSGGAISQLVATGHPARVGRLILTNCDLYENFPPKLFAYLKPAARVPGVLTGVAQTLRIPLLRRTPFAYGVLTKRPIDGALLEEWVRPGIEDAAIRRDTRKFILGSSPNQTIEAARALESFQAPTLFAWAPEDHWFKVAQAERLAASMPDARVVRIPDAKTFVALDQPERLAEAIASFMRDTEPGAPVSPSAGATSGRPT
jgi:pimeloyl-ACP methyl ester carboxylesterase